MSFTNAQVPTINQTVGMAVFIAEPLKYSKNEEKWISEESWSWAYVRMDTQSC